jgi:hypothetical protein
MTSDDLTRAVAAVRTALPSLLTLEAALAGHHAAQAALAQQHVDAQAELARQQVDAIAALLSSHGELLHSHRDVLAEHAGLVADSQRGIVSAAYNVAVELDDRRIGDAVAREIRRHDRRGGDR